MAMRYYQLLVINEPERSKEPLLTRSSRLLGLNPVSGASPASMARIKPRIF